MPRPCVRQTTRRYTERPSPPYPAQACRGQRRRGNDGGLWVSRRNAAGVFTWRRAAAAAR